MLSQCVRSWDEWWHPDDFAPGGDAIAWTAPLRFDAAIVAVPLSEPVARAIIRHATTGGAIERHRTDTVPSA
jgi:hypothetical protein